LAKIRKSFETSKFLASLVSISPFLVVASFGVFLAAKHVQAVADVEHGVRVDAVVALKDMNK
jgi:hypothetical protein